MWTGRHVLSGYPFCSCTSCRKEHDFAEVLVSVVQRVGCSNVKLSHDRPLLLRGLRLGLFLDSQHMKVVSLSALCTGCLYPLGDILGTHFFGGLNRSQGHSVAGRMKSMMNLGDPIRNRIHVLLVCSTVPQPIVLPHNKY